MSMEHKAFLFAYTDFVEQLAPLLLQALQQSDARVLIDFIETHRDTITDPYEGLPLDDGWGAANELKSVQEAGDFALTTFYVPNDDVGLGSDWLEIQDFLNAHEINTTDILLGLYFGPEDDIFDPGKMGSYFQSEEQVRTHLATLRALVERDRAAEDVLGGLIDMFERAVQENKGLYVTF